jgi:aryl carrier-like protein
LTAEDSRASDAGAGQLTLDCGPDELLDELLLEILDDHALGTNLLGLGLDGIPVFRLSNIGKEGNHGVTLLNHYAWSVREELRLR